MNLYKLKHLTPYQRLKFNIKQESKKPQNFWRRLKIMWWRHQMETIKKRSIMGEL